MLFLHFANQTLCKILRAMPQHTPGNYNCMCCATCKHSWACHSFGLSWINSVFMCFILVHRPVYSAGLWLLLHHQGDRPQESNWPNQTARLHWGDPRKHWPQRKLTSPAIQQFGHLNKGFFLILFVCVLLAFMQKHPAPEDWLYKEARGLFLKPEVVNCSTVELKWNDPDEEGLIQFMCSEKQFRWTISRLSVALCSMWDSSFSLPIEGRRWWSLLWLLK